MIKCKTCGHPINQDAPLKPKFTDQERWASGPYVPSERTNIAHKFSKIILEQKAEEIEEAL